MTQQRALTPPPGSPAAVSKGCECAVLDNAHGRGYMGNPEVFVITVGCPLHHPTQKEAKE